MWYQLRLWMYVGVDVAYTYRTIMQQTWCMYVMVILCLCSFFCYSLWYQALSCTHMSAAMSSVRMPYYHSYTLNTTKSKICWHLVNLFNRAWLLMFWNKLHSQLCLDFKTGYSLSIIMNSFLSFLSFLAQIQLTNIMHLLCFICCADRAVKLMLCL